MPTVSKILCPETQYDEDTLIDNPPRKAPICLDFSLYVKSVNIPDFPHARWANAGNGWVIISPTRELAVMPVDLQSMTWSHFQGLAIQHLGQHQPPMARLLGAAHNNGALLWQAFILGNVQFSQKNKTIIHGPKEFRVFADQAYHEFPNRVSFKILMLEPPGNVVAKGAKESTDNDKAPAGKNDGVTKAPAARTRIRPTKSKRGLIAEDGSAAVGSTSAMSNHVVEGETVPSDRPAKHAKKVKTPVGHDTDEIEVIRVPSAVPPATTPLPNSHSGVNRVPLGPESPQLEAVDMETYLMVSHISPTDQATRRRLRTHGIIHWTFFRATSEAELLDLGFTLGIACLLCEGVPRLEAYVAERSVPL
ncbi:hypothetical protein PGT21_019083 [Puccinia graminis f. sp. tritici]|uniref:Uncharacterized protein n=1 Tax=Puccinia graminis f. sp. tritici TaxID=56615 RepID=A0A5B0R2K9_PUCGR|nr:hypothetical protein PGT21_019083 [Puccinia graminis f. sp. tritici]